MMSHRWRIEMRAARPTALTISGLWVGAMDRGQTQRPRRVNRNIRCCDGAGGFPRSVWICVELGLRCYSARNRGPPQCRVDQSISRRNICFRRGPDRRRSERLVTGNVGGPPRSTFTRRRSRRADRRRAQLRATAESAALSAPSGARWAKTNHPRQPPSMEAMITSRSDLAGPEPRPAAAPCAADPALLNSPARSPKPLAAIPTQSGGQAVGGP